MPPGVAVSERGVPAHGMYAAEVSRAQNRPSRSREAAAEVVRRTGLLAHGKLPGAGV